MKLYGKDGLLREAQEGPAMDFLIEGKDKNIIIEDIRKGYTTAAINGAYQSNLAYRPEFISNDYRQGKKVLSAIENELRDCDEI